MSIFFLKIPLLFDDKKDRKFLLFINKRIMKIGEIRIVPFESSIRGRINTYQRYLKQKSREQLPHFISRLKNQVITIYQIAHRTRKKWESVHKGKHLFGEENSEDIIRFYRGTLYR